MIKKVNIADGTTWTYSYNAMNQQTGAIETDSSGTTLADERCVFDVFGNRIEETTDTYSGTTVTTTQTKFVYTMDGTLYADLEGSGTVVSRYVSDVDGPNHWLARVDAGGRGAWLLSDYEGSVCTLVSLDGTTVLDRIVYDAFGNITSDADPSHGGRIKFQGGEYDSMTLTYLFGPDGRIYNPQTDTWNRPDPMGFAGGQTNLYEAMGNVPTNGTDPSGRYLVTSANDTEGTGYSFVTKLLRGWGYHPTAVRMWDGRYYLHMPKSEEAKWNADSWEKECEGNQWLGKGGYSDTDNYEINPDGSLSKTTLSGMDLASIKGAQPGAEWRLNNPGKPEPPRPVQIASLPKDPLLTLPQFDVVGSFGQPLRIVNTKNPSEQYDCGVQGTGNPTMDRIAAWPTILAHQVGHCLADQLTEHALRAMTGVAEIFTGLRSSWGQVA